MKTIFLLFTFLTCTLLPAQLRPNYSPSSKEKQYTYHIKLMRIQNVSYPGKEIQLKLMQRAALFNNQDMISPKQSSMSQICPNFLYGYMLSAAGNIGKCEIKEKNTLVFKYQINLGDTFSIKIPTNQLKETTKLTLGIYGAELLLPNGEKKKLNKVVMRSFHLDDFDHSVRNYIKYEFQIQGATIILDYLIERGTTK